jgi:hypothetical protein
VAIPHRGKQRHRSGYFYNQFADAFRRFPEPPAGVFNPDDTHAETSPKTASVTGVSGENPANPRESATSSTPGLHQMHRAGQVYQKSSKSAEDETKSPLTPDALGDFGGFAVCVPNADEWSWLGEAERTAAEANSTSETSNPAGNLDPAPPEKERPTARPRQAKANGGDPLDPVAGSRAFSMLDLPEPEVSVTDYTQGSIAAEVRQLRAANPRRSVEWIAKQSGQPRSMVREILSNGEGSQ